MSKIEDIKYHFPNDLNPVTSPISQQKQYSRFHKSLISHGFIMIQYSIYVKIVNTESKVQRVIDKIKIDLPSHGNIRILVVTDKQYQDMIFLVGDKNLNEQINTNERYIKC